MRAAGAARINSQRAERVANMPYAQWIREVSPEFIWDRPFHDLLFDTIDRIIAGDLTQVSIHCPPRLGKSEMVTIRLPVYFIERNPGARVIIGAYNKDLATVFARRSLELYQQRNPDMVQKSAEDEWTTRRGGGVVAVGVGSGVTGRGADLIIVDDPVKGAEDAASAAYQTKVWKWWKQDIRTRRNNLARTPTVLIQTRWTELDLAGRVLAADSRKAWTVVSLPALAEADDILGRTPGESIWPDRMPEQELNDLRDEMGSAFEAMYQQNPTPDEGTLIKDEWFTFDVVDERRVLARCRFWDLAASRESLKNRDPDFTVGVKMCLMAGEHERDYTYLVEDVVRVRLDTGDRDRLITRTIQEDGEDCAQYLEEGDDGDKSVTHYIRQAVPGYRVEGVKPRRDKVVRSSNFRSALQKRQVRLVRAPWNHDYRKELIYFPLGKHDDQVDGSSGAYNQLIQHSLIVKIQ